MTGSRVWTSKLISTKASTREGLLRLWPRSSLASDCTRFVWRTTTGGWPVCGAGDRNTCRRGDLTTKNVVYTLFNYVDDPQNFKDRVTELLSWGVTSYPMRFEPLTSLTKNAWVSPNWTDAELPRLLQPLVEYWDSRERFLRMTH